MLRTFVTAYGALMLAVGLLGFFVPNVLYLVQFDLWQSLLYAALGAVGLMLGLKRSANLNQNRYLNALAIVNLALLMLGLSFPNLGDIFHLEVPEHVFHGVVGATAALLADYYRKHSS
ncbi:MAG: hypothetical protein Q8P77_03245 [Candidatus Veblenbacteria bacterium]|nr:hypothetical protein [Candidatus Veblenbacteria bacterium]